MDVVNLLRKEDHKGDSDEAPACAVADNIKVLACGTRGHASIYFVFTEKVTLTQPFKLLYFSSSKSISRLNASFALQNGYPMWDMNDKKAPRKEKFPNDYIKFDFFQGPNGKGDGIVYTWMDVCGREDTNVAPECARQLKSAKKRNMSLYLTFPLKDSSVFVLSEKSFASYVAMKCRNEPIPMNRIECLILKSNCLSAMSMLSCGHCVCETCWDSAGGGANEPTKICMFCRNNYTEITRIKLRRGPCPIDLCNPGESVCNPEDLLGAVLMPCACRIHCKYFQDACVKSNGNYSSIIARMPYCPYDACKKSVKSIVLLKS